MTNATVYIINDDKVIVERNYQELCDEYAKQTTTPFGVGRVDFFEIVNGYETYLTGRGDLSDLPEWYNTHTEAIEAAEEIKVVDVNEQRGNELVFDTCEVRPAIRYDLRSYNGWNGSSRSHRLVETEVESIEWLDKCACFDFENDIHAPFPYNLREDAEKFLLEVLSEEE